MPVFQNVPVVVVEEDGREKVCFNNKGYQGCTGRSLSQLKHSIRFGDPAVAFAAGHKAFCRRQGCYEHTHAKGLNDEICEGCATPLPKGLNVCPNCGTAHSPS